MKIIQAPLSSKNVIELKAGEEVLINGTIYAARDAAHKNMVESLEKGKEMPFAINGQIIYYTGPCPPAPGKVIGSAGPTTSSRMDAYTPALLHQGLKVMIGKGDRSPEVISAMQSEHAVYLAAVGGAGAYLAQRIIAAKVIAYPELGPEALYELKVKDFPCIVAIDAHGNNLYQR
ncbi:MAG TPA: Fe-S-containing hydro-lyase [Syntrophomonadaceae bacterium]|nr:Fe-S-containing hydro-lyase [Syntrophomonadaceae bacterium]